METHIEYQNKVKEANKDFFNEIAGTYDAINARSHQGMEFNLGRMLKELAVRAGNQSTLDLCCGTGIVPVYARRHFRRTYGVDLSSNMLKMAKRYTDVICADATQLPFKDCSFNIVTCCGGLHHLYEFQPLFRESFRVIRKGGFLYIDHEINKRFMQRYKGAIKCYRDFFGVEKRYLKKNKGLDVAQYRLAEYHSYYETGVNPQEVAEALSQAGFKEITINYHCMGAGVVVNFLLSLFRIKSTPEFMSPFFLIVARK